MTSVGKGWGVDFNGYEFLVSAEWFCLYAEPIWSVNLSDDNARWLYRDSKRGLGMIDDRLRGEFELRIVSVKKFS